MNNGITTPSTRAAIAGRRIVLTQAVLSCERHAVCMPRPSRTINGIVGTRNATLNQGGPIEIFPPVAISMTSGASVPIRTSAVATTSSTLFSSRNVSRDNKPKPTSESSEGARQAYSTSAPTTTTARKERMKNPRVGSVANACTDTMIPERTRNVPSRLSENAVIASNNVQLLNKPRFSVTASEWMSAVPISHGMNDAFSTASQNHQPPQPSS